MTVEAGNGEVVTITVRGDNAKLPRLKKFTDYSETFKMVGLM